MLWNPFEDIVPRTTPQERAAEAQRRAAEAAAAEAAARGAARPRKRNLALLSFGEDAEDEEAQVAAMGRRAKVGSAHEALRGDARLAAPEETPEVEALERRRQEALERVRASLKAGGGGGDGGAGEREGGSGGGGGRESAAERVARERAERRAREGGSDAGDGEAAGGSGSESDGERRREQGERGGDGSGGSDGGGGGDRGGAKKRDSARAAVAERRELLREKRTEALQRGIGRVQRPDAVADADLLKPWQAAREAFKNKKRAIGDRQRDTLARLAAFTGKLRGGGEGEDEEGGSGGGGKEQRRQKQQKAGSGGGSKEGGGGEGEEEEHYDGRVKQSVDHRAYLPAAWRVDDYGEGGDGDEGDGGADEDNAGGGLAALRRHRLEFAKGAAAGELQLGGDGRALDDYVVLDPLLEAAKGKFSKQAQAAQREKKQKAAWASSGRGVG